MPRFFGAFSSVTSIVLLCYILQQGAVDTFAALKNNKLRPIEGYDLTQNISS
jgi:hypothetical protein